MSEDEKIVRYGIPKDEVAMFVATVQAISLMCKISKVPEIQHQVDLLVRAADTYLFEKQHGSNSAKPADEKKRFIIIFKNRHQVSLDYEYPSKTVSPVEIRMIDDFIQKKLMPKHIDADFYLEWFFDTFLVRKPNFNPPNLKLSCSNVCWESFLYDMKEKLKEKKEQALKESEVQDLINRARESIRRTSDVSLKTKIADVLKKFTNKSIMFLEFRKSILELENESKRQGEE